MISWYFINQYSRHNLGHKKYKLYDLGYFNSSSVSIDATAIIKDLLNENLHSV